MKKFGIVYHPKIAAAKTLAEQLSEFLPSLKATAWICSAWDEEGVKAQAPGTDVVLSIGGDGTILRVARAITPQGIPIVGINLGHLGFMAELNTEDIMDNLPHIISGEGWIDQRAMLEIELLPSSRGKPSPKPFHALNDAVVGRGAFSRVVYVKTTINDQLFTTYKADGVIISTATGSTGYSLAAGGPILYPQAEEILLKPISPHLTMAHCLVLPPTATVGLEVRTDHQAMLSIDGQLDLELQDGNKVKVKRSPYSARFMRIHPPNSFYGTLEEKLKGRSWK